jgi:amidase
MIEELVKGSAVGMAKAIREGQVSCADLLEAQLDRVDRYNEGLNAIIWQDRESARELAIQLDVEAKNGTFRGLLHGVPVTIKEAFDLKGAPSTWGSPALKDNIPAENSAVAQHYIDAGAIIFGKTNVPLNLADWQTFNDVYGTTNNPWDLNRGPGGSSGGSTAALAAAMTALEAGSDIGSSIRNPAHYCGVFGHKPTWGIVPGAGHMVPGYLMDIDIGVQGPLARNAGDLSLGFDLLAQTDRFWRGAWRPDLAVDAREKLSDFRIAIKLGDPACAVDQGYLDSIAAFGEKLAATGAKVSFEEQPEIDSEAHFTNYMTLLGAALSFGFSEEDDARDLAKVQSLNDPMVSRLVEPRINGRSFTHREWFAADNERRQSRLKFDDFFTNWDVLIVPVCSSAAFPHNQEGVRFERKLTINGKEQPEMQQLFWSGYSGVVGLPSTVGPMDFVDGLPVGYQAITGYGRDHTGLAFACAVEREIGGFVAPPGYD